MTKKFPALPFMSADQPQPAPPIPPADSLHDMPDSQLLSYYRSPRRERRTVRRLIMITPALDARIRAAAYQRGDSINNTIFEILEDSLK